jgi:hypothetical protein
MQGLFAAGCEVVLFLLNQFTRVIVNSLAVESHAGTVLNTDLFDEFGLPLQGGAEELLPDLGVLVKVDGLEGMSKSAWVLCC